MSRIRVSDWVKLGDQSHARLGLKVFDQADPRHVGELIAIEHSAFGVIRWDGTGWKSRIRLGDLHRYREEPEPKLIIEAFDRREFADLIGEYQRWQKANQIRLGSPYDHLTDRHLTAAQRRWLKDYVKRWEARI